MTGFLNLLHGRGFIERWGPVYDFIYLESPLGNLNVIFSFCREINGEKKNFCLVTNPRKKLKYRMFTEVES